MKFSQLILQAGLDPKDYSCSDWDLDVFDHKNRKLEDNFNLATPIFKTVPDSLKDFSDFLNNLEKNSKIEDIQAKLTPDALIIYINSYAPEIFFRF